MAVVRKMRQGAVVDKPVIDEKKIESLINKGGSSTKAQHEKKDEGADKKPIKLIPYLSQLNEIEIVLRQLPKRGRPSRHAYILQAIDEKLERDKKKLKLP